MAASLWRFCLPLAIAMETEYRLVCSTFRGQRQLMSVEIALHHLKARFHELGKSLIVDDAECRPTMSYLKFEN